MKRCRRHVLAARAVLLVAGISANSEAEVLPGSKPEESDQPRNRYESVVAATRQRSTVYESPRAVSVVERDELRSRPPRTTVDAVNDEEGVFIQRTHYAAGGPSIRGLTGNRVLLMVDGIRLNTTLTSSGPGGILTLIDPSIVESTEVIRGPASSSYGSDALGGVVYVRTRQPVPIAASEIELRAGLRGIFASYDESGQGSVWAGGRWGRYALDGTFSLRRFGDLKGGSDAPQQPMSGYREGGLAVGSGVDLGRAGTLVFVYQGARQYDAVLTDRSQPDDLHLVNEAGRDLIYLRYSNNLESLARPLGLSATVSYQRQRQVVDRLQVPLDRLDRDTNHVDVLGASALAEADIGRAGRLTAGIEGYFEWVESAGQYGMISAGPQAQLLGSPFGGRYPGGSTAQSIQVFLQDEVDLERAVGLGTPGRASRLRALIAVRAGANLIGIPHDGRLAGLYPQLGQAAVTPARLEVNPVYAGSIHVRYEIWPGLALSVGGMTGIRAPNLSDYAFLGRYGSRLFIPTEGLRPELAYAAEVGVRGAFRRLEGAAYYAFTYLDQAITPLAAQVAGSECAAMVAGTCTERLYRQANAEQVQLHSVEATVRLHIIGGLSAFTTVSYTHGNVDRSRVVGQVVVPSGPFHGVPPFNGVTAVQLRRPRSIFSFAEVSLRWALPQGRLGGADLDDVRFCLPMGAQCNGTPWFAILSVRGAARLSRQIYVTGAVENLANSSYRYHGSFIDGPGLGATLSLEASY